jgi:hypothetical protein
MRSTRRPVCLEKLCNILFNFILFDGLRQGQLTADTNCKAPISKYKLSLTKMAPILGILRGCLSQAVFGTWRHASLLVGLCISAVLYRMYLQLRMESLGF